MKDIDEWLSYDPNTGDLTWIKSPAPCMRAGRFAGSPHSDGNNSYYEVGFQKKTYKAHRIAWLLHYGEMPDGVIDHLDGNGLNNRIDNLRCVSVSENRRNCRKYINNSSGHTGVLWHKKQKRWISRIRVDGSLINLGSFKTKLAAVYCRHFANIQHGFTSRHGQ